MNSDDNNTCINTNKTNAKLEECISEKLGCNLFCERRKIIVLGCIHLSKNSALEEFTMSSSHNVGCFLNSQLLCLFCNKIQFLFCFVH